MSREEPKLPAWWRRPGESWRDYDRRRIAENVAAQEHKLADYPKPTGGVIEAARGLAVGVGTYDCNGNPKGSGW